MSGRSVVFFSDGRQRQHGAQWHQKGNRIDDVEAQQHTSRGGSLFRVSDRCVRRRRFRSDGADAHAGDTNRHMGGGRSRATWSQVTAR